MKAVSPYQLRMSHIRHSLKKSDEARQQAISVFILRNAHIADDMCRMLSIELPSPERRASLNYCESLIRENFRQTFGQEMIE